MIRSFDKKRVSKTLLFSDKATLESFVSQVSAKCTRAKYGFVLNDDLDEDQIKKNTHEVTEWFNELHKLVLSTRKRSDLLASIGDPLVLSKNQPSSYSLLDKILSPPSSSSSSSQSATSTSAAGSRAKRSSSVSNPQGDRLNPNTSSTVAASATAADTVSSVSSPAPLSLDDIDDILSPSPAKRRKTLAAAENESADIADNSSFSSLPLASESRLPPTSPEEFITAADSILHAYYQVDTKIANKTLQERMLSEFKDIALSIGSNSNCSIPDMVASLRQILDDNTVDKTTTSTFVAFSFASFKFDRQKAIIDLTNVIFGSESMAVEYQNSQSDTYEFKAYLLCLYALITVTSLDQNIVYVHGKEFRRPRIGYFSPDNVVTILTAMLNIKCDEV